MEVRIKNSVKSSKILIHNPNHEDKITTPFAKWIDKTLLSNHW